MADHPLTLLRALVLSRAHHCLLVRDGADFRVPALSLPLPTRPLAALSRHVQDTLGLTLPSPSGVRRGEGGLARDFVFLMDAPPSAEGAPFTWVPLPRAIDLASPNGDGAWMWDVYVDRMLGGYEPPTREVDVFYFGDGPEMASKLAHLVTSGDKRGTAGWVRAAKLDGSTIPSPGLVSIVTDGFGHPRCVIETESVRRLPISEADEEIAILEGEGDLTLADWREGHMAFFEREAAKMGLAFDAEEEVFVEKFRVLHVVGRCP